MRPDKSVGADRRPPFRFERGLHVMQCVREFTVVIDRVAGRQRLRAGAQDCDLNPLPGAS